MENVHLRRTYGRASSVMRFAGAPMETTAAAFAIKTFLLWPISSVWQPEKFLLTEEVVHSEDELSSGSSDVELKAKMLELASSESLLVSPNPAKA